MNGSERVHEILRELGELHDNKQSDYGTASDPFANVRATEDWGIPAWVGSGIRLNDKVQRLKSMHRNGRLNNESVEDSFRDIAVYAIIGLVLYEEAQNDGEATMETAMETWQGDVFPYPEKQIESQYNENPPVEHTKWMGLDEVCEQLDPVMEGWLRGAQGVSRPELGRFPE